MTISLFRNCQFQYKIYRINHIRAKTLILLVTLCNEFILILQPNFIFNVFHIRTMNLSRFWIHTTMYLIFQFSMGYGICHGFVSIIHLWLHFFPYYDNKFILLLYPYHQIFYVLYHCSYSLLCFWDISINDGNLILIVFFSCKYLILIMHMPNVSDAWYIWKCTI